MKSKIEKINVERVFNIGNYQSIRFAVEVSTECCDSHSDLRRLFDNTLTELEKCYDDIMKERAQKK